ncbi:hypothetical protein HPB48_014801 [Haemaphysalis longicornis]|uniref:Uncharacterized protein n=1 Tax=Haemaphysalis longicornis TaxID=44386 RepID=A0A9J6GDW2_HAELO|nr:hypothetical protein HPB48_014801 [Haemaphysalis longicornis]
MRGHDLGWDDFVCANEDTDTSEPCTDEGIVNEVRGKSDAKESDADDDEASEPAPISSPNAMGYIEDLEQLVYTNGLGEEHAAALNKLETAVIHLHCINIQPSWTSLRKNKLCFDYRFFFY